MTDTTRATVTCAVCGDRQTLLGSTWEVTVATEVWAKTRSHAAHHGETVAVRVNRPETRQGPARRARPTDR